MRRRDIPYVVKGLNRLFDSPEIQAVVGVFRYMAGLSRRSLTCAALWDDANLAPGERRLGRGACRPGRGSRLRPGRAVGRLQHPAPLPRVPRGARRCARRRCRATRCARELVFYQLGKFSQAISDFEAIYFNTEPAQKYESFADWLEHQAPDYYAESDADVGYATPDAVTLTTVHQAKGMQWPAVFIPCLRKNRFPSKRHGGLGLFHVIPDAAIADAGPLPRHGRGRDAAVLRRGDPRAEVPVRVVLARPEQALQEAVGRSSTTARASSGSRPGTPACRRTRRDSSPRPATRRPNVTLSFSELKYLFECPYQFKLRFLYGFNPPLHEALGYGKGLHDALSEVHKRALAGDVVGNGEAEDLVDRHLHTPYAYPALRQTLHDAAVKSVQRYLDEHGSTWSRTVHSEKQIQVHVAPGITVDGRIDLVRRLDTDELAIVDFKSTARAQDEDVTRDQLHVYAVGYEELTGERADLIEVLNLDEEGKTIREEVEEPLLVAVRAQDQGRRRLRCERTTCRGCPVWGEQCTKCDLAELCRDVPADQRKARRTASGR